MSWKSLGSWKRAMLLLLLSAAFPGLALHGQQSTVFQIDFTNAKLIPPHWQLTLNPDGSGQFDAEAGHPVAQEANLVLAGDVHRPIQLSAAFTEQVFSTARTRKLFAFPCDSHMKVAFQGLKRLSYSGPEGSGKLTVAPLNVFGKDLVTVATSSAALARWTERTAERAKEIRQSENPWTLKFETGLRRLGIIGRAKAVMFIGGKLFSELLG